MVARPASPGKIADPDAAGGTPGSVHASPRSGAPAARAWYQQAQSARYAGATLPSADLAGAGDDAQSRAWPAACACLSRVPQPQSVPTPDKWLASGDRHVLVGGPGSGKTTFLRYLVLDMLSTLPPSPSGRGGSESDCRYGFRSTSSLRGGPVMAMAGLLWRQTLRAWLEQYDAADLWPLVEVALQEQAALRDHRRADEWVSESAGHSALVGLESFLGTRKVPALVSARPYGLDRMPLAGEWDYASMAEPVGRAAAPPGRPVVRCRPRRH